MTRLVGPPGLDQAGLAERLAPLGKLVAGTARRERVSRLDTFDWRAHRAGILLEEVRTARAVRFRARAAASGGVLQAAPGPAPRFARDLPPGPLRELLEPLLEPRAILPLATVETTRVPLRLRLRGRRRAALRFALETALVGAPGAEPQLPLPPALDFPARAGAAPAALLAALPGLAPETEDALAAALAPLGRVPRDYSGKVKVDIAPGATAREAAAALLRNLLETLERNLPGVREDLDPEFLHDFRVAVRRTRSALGQIRGVLPAAATARFAAELARLQQLTGRARDLDVYLLELPRLGALLPASARRSLGPLARLLARRRLEAYRVLAAELDSPRLAAFLARWRAFLEAPLPRRRSPGAPHALEPARAVAARRIGRLFRRALAEGGTITDASPAAALHELRKTCKKLRYLLEFFHGLFDREEAALVVEALKELQDNLGRHQDLQVQAAELLAFARELGRGRGASPPAFVAMGMLVERLRELQAEARREFAERFREFSRRENRRRVRRLLRERNSGAGAAAGEASAAPPARGEDLPAGMEGEDVG